MARTHYPIILFVKKTILNLIERDWMRSDFVASLILISLLIIPIVLSASVFTDKTDYNVLETVNITGTGFSDGEDILIEIYDQTSATPVFQDDINADGSGNFLILYPISEIANPEKHDVYASGTVSGMVSTYFMILEDIERPQWSDLYHEPTIVTMLDDITIYVKWSDNINLGKVLIWENSTGNWASHDVGV